MNPASAAMLPDPAERLEAREPKRRPSEILASETWFLAKVVGGVVSGLYLGFQVLGIGLVTQKEFGAMERRVSVLEYATGVHTETFSDTNQRTSQVYQPGHER